MCVCINTPSSKVIRQSNGFHLRVLQYQQWLADPPPTIAIDSDAKKKFLVPFATKIEMFNFFPIMLTIDK